MRMFMGVVGTSVLAAAILFLRPQTVKAEDYIANAAQALKQTPVYVSPGTEGTDRDTAGKLQGMLNKSDNIVLVMLPAAAENELGVDPATIASRLSEKLGNQRTIGLAVGRKVVGYAPKLPAGVSADQMRRAESVSNDSITALGTFVQNMHIWLSANPQPTPVPFDETQPEKGTSWSLVLFFICIAMFGVLMLIRESSVRNAREKTRFEAPDPVKNLLAKIARNRVKVKDMDLQQALYQMCLDIETYFKSSSGDEKKDSFFFTERLTEVSAVLIKYIDVQENRRYYNGPEEELEKGKAAIESFSGYVLESIRNGNAVDLIDYSVNTNILYAQRHRR